jgi:hypothetical protein
MAKPWSHRSTTSREAERHVSASAARVPADDVETGVGADVVVVLSCPDGVASTTIGPGGPQAASESRAPQVAIHIVDREAFVILPGIWRADSG